MLEIKAAISDTRNTCDPFVNNPPIPEDADLAVGMRVQAGHINQLKDNIRALYTDRMEDGAGVPSYSGGANSVWRTGAANDIAAGSPIKKEHLVDMRYALDYFRANYCTGICDNNGIEDFFEECDDGNLDNCDGCTTTCKIPSVPDCGNSSMECGEECDDGDSGNVDSAACDSGEYCNTSCKKLTADACVTPNPCGTPAVMGGRSRTFTRTDDSYIIDYTAQCNGANGMGPNCYFGGDADPIRNAGSIPDDLCRGSGYTRAAGYGGSHSTADAATYYAANRTTVIDGPNCDSCYALSSVICIDPGCGDGYCDPANGENCSNCSDCNVPNPVGALCVDCDWACPVNKHTETCGHSCLRSLTSDDCNECIRSDASCDCCMEYSPEYDCCKDDY